MNTKYLFSKELIEKLKPIHNHLENASRFHYKRGSTQAENDLLTEVWYELTNEKLTGFTCGSCCLKNYSMVGRVYFESIEYWEAQNKITETKTEDICQETVEATSTPRQRKSKRVKQ